MSFEVEYDNEGFAIGTKNAQVFEVPTETPIQEQQSQTNLDLSAEPAETNLDLEASDPAKQPETEVITPVKQPRDTKESWSDLREKAWQAERRAKDLEYQLAQATKQVNPEREVESSWKEDDFVEGRHLSAVEKKIKAMEAKLAQYESQTSTSLAETKLKSQYNDFDSVVSAENLQTLQEEYPELAQTIYAGDDLYSKGKSAYIMLKKLGIAKEKEDPRMVQDRAQALKNAAKPKPLSSIAPHTTSSGPLSKVNAFTQGSPVEGELQEQLVKQMEAALKGY